MIHESQVCECMLELDGAMNHKFADACRSLMDTHVYCEAREDPDGPVLIDQPFSVGDSKLDLHLQVVLERKWHMVMMT